MQTTKIALSAAEARLNPFDFRASCKPPSAEGHRHNQVSIPLTSGLHANRELRRISLADIRLNPFDFRASCKPDTGRAPNPGSDVSIPLTSGLHANLLATTERRRQNVSIPLTSGLHANVGNDDTEPSEFRLNPFDFRASCKRTCTRASAHRGRSQSL